MRITLLEADKEVMEAIERSRYANETPEEFVAHAIVRELAARLGDRYEREDA